MRRLVALVILIAALAYHSEAAIAACSGQEVTRTGPTGITLRTCLDGKYTTCVRDGQRLGYRDPKSFCDDLKAKGRVK